MALNRCILFWCTSVYGRIGVSVPRIVNKFDQNGQFDCSRLNITLGIVLRWLKLFSKLL